MNRILCLTVAFLLLITLVTVHASPPRYVVFDIDSLNDTWSLPTAMNQRGEIVGLFGIEPIDGWDIGSFVWSNGNMAALSVSDNCFTPTCINNRGDIVGQDYFLKPYLLRNGEVTQIPVLEPSINDEGQIVGRQERDGEDEAVMLSEGKLELLEGMSGASGINNRGQVCGYKMTLENDLQRCTPCIWQNGAATQLPLPEGRTDGYTFTISDSGYVAGYAYNAGQEYGDTACLWKDGVLVSLADAEGSFVSCVRDVNDAGQAVGYKDWSAVLWDDGNCYKINDLLINNNRYVSDAICIDNRGQIAAERGAFLWTSTTLLLVPGVEVKIDIMPDDATNMIWLNNNRPVTVAVTGSEAFAVSSIAPESVRFAGSRPSHWLVRDVDGDRFLDMVLWFAKDSLQIDPYVDYRQDLSGRTTCGGAFAGVDFVNYLYRTKPGKK